MKTHLRSLAVTALCMLGVAAATIAVPVAPAAAEVKDRCAGAKQPPVVNVTRSVRNLTDFAVDGHVWALTSFEERIQIYRVGVDRYCTRRDAQGTFATFAGASPNLTGTVPAGLTGTFEWTIFHNVTGDLMPTVPVSGYIGEVDARCQPDGTCADTAWRLGVLFFPNGLQAARIPWASAVYDAGANGVFTQNNDGAFGDITG